MSKIHVYRALMPSHYVPRRNAAGAAGTSHDASRKWVATRLPRIRVYGPFWSFGFTCHETPETARPDGKVPVQRGLRALSEVLETTPNPQLGKPHDPTWLSVQVASFLQVSPAPDGRPTFSESRMSLLAIRSIHPDRIDGNGQLTKLDADDFPVANGGPVLAGAGGRPTALVVAPFGDRQPKPETTFRQGKGGTVEVPAVEDQHLPAMQLMLGQVRFRPTNGYLAKARRALGLDPPAGLGDGDTIVLLPDGFALAGSIGVPWMKGKPVSGWFKVTFRWLDPGMDPDQAAVDAPADSSPGPVLRPWFNPEGGDAIGRAAWDEVIARFEAVLRGARQGEGAPRWLDIRPDAELRAESFFWPLAYDGTEAEPSILLCRQERTVLGIDGAGLLVRLADRPVGEAPVATLTIEPKAFVVTATASGFTIATEAALPPGRDIATASYVYARPAAVGMASKETISIGRLDDKGEPIDRVELVVPMIDTADTLRQAMGLPRPTQTTDDDKVLPPLWTFTPLDEGWLHWPLPNATPGILSRLVGMGVPPPPAVREDAGDGISGAILFGNRPGNPGYTPGERSWSLSIGEPRLGSMSVALELVGPEATLAKASVELHDFAITFDGVVPLTPFRQTPERLLPEHAERALTTIGLRAVSPSRLTRLEHDLWMTEGAPRFTVTLDGVAITNAANAGATRNRVAANLSWSLAMPAATGRDVPWIWVRHASLPTVQTLPLALAGKARNAPGEARALAPFVYEGKGTHLTYACTARALDMTRPTIALDPSVADSVGAGRFRRPVHASAPDGSAADPPRREELGMAVTTLPSLTLFPGLASGAPGVAPDASQWSAYPSYAVTVLARHDIALRDAFHALAAAPANMEPGAEPPPPPQLFAPRPDNAPCSDRLIRPDGATTGRDVRTNGYDRVWAELSRKAGLAALDRRDMLAVGKGETHLVGVFGEIEYPVGKVGFDLAIGVERTGEAIVAVTQIGAWSLGRLANVAPPELALAGLPRGTDLTGLSGIFARGASGGIEVRHGTAVLKPIGDAFTDQHGIAVGWPSRPGEVVKDAVVKTVTGRAAKHRRQLLTLVKPVPVAGAGSLAFWCADVPVGAGDGSFLAAYADDAALRLDGASLDNDPFAGFRWTLADPVAPADVAVIDGLAFEPLALEGLTLNVAADALDTVTIRGRLLLPVGDAGSPVLPRAGGSARLRLTMGAGGRLLPRLEGTNIVWPLVDPQTATGFVPTLSMDVLPDEGKGGPANLSFGFADAVFSVGLTLTRPAGPRQRLLGALAGGAPDASELGTIATRTLDLTIGAAGRDARGKLVLLQTHGAKLTFGTEIGLPDARLVATLTHDLLAMDEPDGIEGLTLHGPGGAVFGVALDENSGGGGSTARALAFGADHVAVRWRLPEADPPPMLLDGLAMTGGRGAFFATLALDTGTAALKALPRMRITGLEDEALYALTTQPDGGGRKGDLQLLRRRRSGESRPAYRLFGTVAVANAFSWPLLSVAAADVHFEEASLPAKPDGRIVHRATITFGGDVLRSDSDGYLIAAAVAHTIEKRRDSGAAEHETWTWQSHQLVRLLPSQAFRARLVEFGTPASKAPADLRKLDTGFSPLVGPDGAPLTDYAAVPHFLHVAASGPGGLAGPLADGLRAAIDERPTPFLAVDLSSHLLLDFRASGAEPPAGPLILASLPAIDFCRSEKGDLPWSDAPAVAAMLATEVPADTRILQSATDGIDARSLPPLERAIADAPTTRLRDACGRLDASAAGAGPGRASQERSHRPVFQAVVLRKDGPAWRPAWDLPGAATAMHLSALLDVGKRARSPLALAFRPFGGISGDDLFPPVQDPRDHPLRHATRMDVGDYARAMRRFRERLLDDFVAGPSALAPHPGPGRTASVLLRLVARARDADDLRVIVEQRETLPEGQRSAILARVAEWGRLGLERLAPWAAAGLAVVSSERQGAQDQRTAIVHRERPAGRPLAPQPVAEAGGDMPAQRQRETVARPAAGAGRLAAGYTPLAAEPRLLTSEPDWTYGEDESDYRLTATGAAMAWSLAGGVALGDGEKSGQPCAYWLTDRYRPAFRPFAKDGPEITFALPVDYRARLPGSLVPANHATPRLAAPEGLVETTGTAQSFAPALVTTSRIASRPGAMAATRTGLVAVFDDGTGPSTLDTSQTPLGLRQPRPPILARNDRVRASSHEPGPFHLSHAPTVILHGPRVAPFGASALPVGLDRRPRSKNALRLVLVSPRAGVAALGWGGEVEVGVPADGAFGELDGAWTVLSAAIVLGSDRYAWRPSAGDRTAVEPGKTFSLIDFRGTPGGRGAEQGARDGLRAVPAATPAAIEITLAWARPEGSLVRQVRFDILSAGAGMAVPGVEAPLFFRFDDPEYNDQLQGIAKLARESSPSAPDEDIVFAADQDDIRPDQRLELALALRPRTPGAGTPSAFSSRDGLLAYGGVPLILTIRRRRAGTPEATPLAADDPPVEGAWPVVDRWGSFHLMANAGPTSFHAMKLDCALLREEGRSTLPGLAPDDQLELAIMPEGTEGSLVALRFDVVAAPAMPANPSAFGVLMLRPDGRSVPVHLFASGPDATVIELVDPLDLVEGVVRRRAIYQWRSFHHAADLNGTTEGYPVRFALQKINGSGGSWLPSDVATGWLAPSNP